MAALQESNEDSNKQALLNVYDSIPGGGLGQEQDAGEGAGKGERAAPSSSTSPFFIVQGLEQ